MADVAGEILAFAVGIAISPIPIIAVILMLFSARARINGPAFLLGWVVGITAVMVIVLVVANAGDVSTDSECVQRERVVEARSRSLSRRPRVPAAAKPSGTRRGGDDAGLDGRGRLVHAGQGVGCGLRALGAQPEEPGADDRERDDARASRPLGEEGRGRRGVLRRSCPALTVGGAVLFYLVGGQRAKTLLDGWKVWLAQNNAVVMCVLLIVIGVALAGKGFDAFD